MQSSDSWSKQHEKIVVTGLGVISPAGVSVPVFFDNICNGVSGISKLSRFDPEPFKCQIAGKTYMIETVRTATNTAIMSPAPCNIATFSASMLATMTITHDTMALNI